MTRWLVRILAALLIAAGSYYATLAATPYVLMEVAVRRVAERGALNSFAHAPPVRAEAQTIVRSSPDLLYSSCPFDLSAGPLQVTATPIHDHYSSISVFDARTDVAFVRNDGQMRRRPITVILALAGQAVPPGIEVVRLRHARGIVLQRVLLTDPRDPAELARVDPIRRRATCRTITVANRE
jgi:uncharacterized membrane protein